MVVDMVNSSSSVRGYSAYIEDLLEIIMLILASSSGYIGHMTLRTLNFQKLGLSIMLNLIASIAELILTVLFFYKSIKIDFNHDINIIVL